MFHVDATFKDMRIIAHENPGDIPGSRYIVIVINNLTGEFDATTISAHQLSMVFALNCHPDGTPDGYEKFYEELDPIFKGWPKNIRPIP